MTGYTCPGCAGKTHGTVPAAAPPEPSAAAPADRERRVRAAYQAAAEGTDVISLDDLRKRPELQGMPRNQVDAALRAMARQSDVHLIAEDNLPALTDDEKAAAIAIGGEPKHLIGIDSAQAPQADATDEPPPNWRDHSDDEDPATGWTQLEVAESQWAARTGKCCYVIADVGFDGPRKLCGHRVALGWIFCSDHLEDISYGDPKSADPERFRARVTDTVRYPHQPLDEPIHN